MTTTPPPKQSQKNTILFFFDMLTSPQTGALTAITMLLVTGISIKTNISFSANSDQTREFTQQQMILPVLYERVEHGMTIVEVQSILGPGIEISSSQTMEAHQWKDSNENCITAIFKDGLLQEKNRHCS